MRLHGHDYSKPGAYFITICTYQRECLFGKIINNKMVLNPMGIIAHDEWMQSSNIRTEIDLDVFVVMPNHLHGIIFIQNLGVQNLGERPLAPTCLGSLGMGLKHQSIGSMIAGFKSSVTKQINNIRAMPGTPVWQRNYYDHIIRNEKSLAQIRQYIINNPQTWENDNLFV